MIEILHDPDVYDLAHLSWWEPINLQDLPHVPRAGPVLHRCCIAYHTDGLEIQIILCVEGVDKELWLTTTEGLVG